MLHRTKYDYTLHHLSEVSKGRKRIENLRGRDADAINLFWL
jgi:hypothetical protein